MSDLYESLRASATRLSENEFVAQIKHPVLLCDFGEDEDEAEFTHVSTVARTIALDRPKHKTAWFVTKQEPGGGTITIGRGDDCDIVIRHASISKHHGDLVVGADRSLGIRDVRSRYGVFVNDRRISSDQVSPLVNGDDVTLGSIAGTLLYPLQLYRLLRGEHKPSPWRSPTPL